MGMIKAFYMCKIINYNLLLPVLLVIIITKITLINLIHVRMYSADANWEHNIKIS